MPITIRTRELREQRGWSLRELARRADVRPSTLSAIENAQTTGVDFQTLERLALALQVHPAVLVHWEQRRRAQR